MTRWEPAGLSESEKEPWKELATWYAQYPSENVGIKDPESFDTNLQLAKAHVDWLLDPENKQSNVQAKKNLQWVTVAVMYDPVSKWHFASTVPRGKRWGIMKNMGTLAAPKWKKAVGNTNSFHAEDAVYFNFESSAKGTNPYSRGTVVATFAKRDPQPGDKFPDGKLPLPACSGFQNKKTPSCQEVARRLGVTFAKAFNGGRPELVEPPGHRENPVDYPDDMADEDWNELERQCGQAAPQRLAIRGREALSNKRAVSSCRTDVYGSTPVLTFSYTNSLDQSTIDHGFTIITPTESSQTSTNNETTTPKPTQTTAAPSCYLQEEDPDAGINTEYCVCDKSRTLPLLTLSSPVLISSSCSYTSLPTQVTTKVTNRDAAPITRHPKAMITPGPSLDDRDISVHTGFDSTTTNSKYCQVCSRVENNENACSSIQGCFAKTGAVTIEAGTSSVHVGTVTGTQLYSSVSSALEKICPTPSAKGDTSCSGDTVSIGGVPYVDAGSLNKGGELVVSVESSRYNESSIRDALIKSAAAAAQNAATGKNCYEQTYSVEILKRSWLSSWMPGFLRRDHPYPKQEKATWCNTVGFVGPHYYNPWWRLAPNPGATDYIDAHWEFEKPGGGDFDCAILEGLVDAFAFIQPEFAVGDIELGEVIDIVCMSGESERRSLRNITFQA
ncbi:hypothetical protein F4818DRAFT_436630 [Hypoxylon cercidicola]|nr:hypothetical protein F4818DRAFT_436630 [Hypoxylon cercidicola]